MEKVILTSENRKELQDLVERKFPNEVTKRRIENGVFEKFIGRVLVIEKDLWFFE